METFSTEDTYFNMYFKYEGVFWMETFGRGCLYIIIGFFALFLLALVTQSHINIPFFIAIPLIILAFWMAKKKTDERNNED